MWFFPTSWKKALKVVYMFGCSDKFMMYISHGDGQYINHFLVVFGGMEVNLYFVIEQTSGFKN